MKHVVLIAPFLGPNMVRCMRAFAALEDVQLGIVGLEPAERLPPDVRAAIAAHRQVRDVADSAQLVEACRAIAREWGGRLDRVEGYLEQLQVPLADARDALRVDGLGGEAARNFRDKNRMKRVLASAGLPVARQALVHGADDARRFVGAVGYPVVLKPLAGLGARNTLRVTDDDQLFSALNQLLPTDAQPVQAEEFVQGEEHTFETVMIDGQPVWSSSTFYLPGPLQVLENAWMQYCLLLPRETSMPHVEAFRGTNAAALRALGMRTGLSHMEWFLRRDGSSVVSEVGARPPGANIMPLIEAAHDADPWAAWARLMVHRTWSMPERRHAVGCAFVRSMGRGNAIGSVAGVDELQERIGPLVVAAKLPQPGQPRSTHYEGDGWVIVRHPETRTVVDALRAVVTTLRIE